MGTKDDAHLGDMARDEQQNREDWTVGVRAAYERSRGPRSRFGAHVLKAAQADGSAGDAVQACLVEQLDDLMWIDVAVPVKVREEA
jgi:hypothetical protein